jgi:Fe(3+) dicitrate transport protein
MNFPKPGAAASPPTASIEALNPVQSVEMNVRQNGYNITADLWLSQKHYLPPAMGGRGRIEIIAWRGGFAVRATSSVAISNYVMRRGPEDKI